MRKDQWVRGLAIAVVTVGFVARSVSGQSGLVDVFGYEVSPFGLFIVAVIVLALPETIEMLPFGPSRKK